jgi:hypothetical protein
MLFNVRQCNVNIYIGNTQNVTYYAPKSKRNNEGEFMSLFTLLAVKTQHWIQKSL